MPLRERLLKALDRGNHRVPCGMRITVRDARGVAEARERGEVAEQGGDHVVVNATLDQARGEGVA